MSSFSNFLGAVDDIVWGVPLIVAILVTGILLTIRVRGLQFSKLGQAFRLMFQKDKESEGEVSSFAALCTALSATIGTGNIVGVATAVVAGGPGALFWMWIAALFGMATKYAECTLAIHYRNVEKDGHILGGPFYYIEKGMGSKFKWLAKLFAIFGVLAGLLGIGTITQVNGITSAAKVFFDPANIHCITLFGRPYSLAIVVTGILVALCTALVVIGGLKRISKVSQVIVPFMAILYVLLGVSVLVFNITAIPAALKEIVLSAFGMRAAAGGALGAIIIAMQKGIARGIFSNEAGLGSAPIAAAAAKTSEPVEQGLVSMTGTFIDTIIICTITGLAIVITGAYKVEGLEGAAVTIRAFQDAIPFAGAIIPFLMMLCLAFFAFTTILGWDYYSERCLEYAVNGNMSVVKVYRWFYIAAVLIGPYMTVSAVWTIADIFNGLMALPNIVALIALSGVTAKLTKDYVDRRKAL